MDLGPRVGVYEYPCMDCADLLSLIVAIERLHVSTHFFPRYGD